MASFAKIKAKCLKNHELWEDPDFPATQTSVFYHQVPPFQFVWLRPWQLYGKPKFVQENYDTFDVVTGRLGDKWLLSCFEMIYMYKSLFFRVVPGDQRLDTKYAGVFAFHIWWCGKWVEVLVDDRLPTVHGKLAFMQCSKSGQLWPALLEKAYAKMHGSYEALKYGNLQDALVDFTGGITEIIDISELDLGEPATLQSLVQTTSIVTAVYATQSIRRIAPGTRYRVLNVERVETIAGFLYLVRLMDPLAPGNSTHLVMDNPEWSTIPLSEIERLTSSTPGFLLLYSDFLSTFSRLELIHMGSEISQIETTLAQKQKWQFISYQGRWMKGVSAGGCRNHAEFFHMNPQIQIELNESDTVFISLSQHSILEPKVIGFSIYKITEPLTENAPSTLFKEIRSSINSEYTNSRQISERCNLESGAYLVIPTIYEPRQEGNFTVRVCSLKPLQMTVLDSFPQILKPAILKAPSDINSNTFELYDSQFIQLADEHKTINAFELQELLESCLPNDYIKSCATIETCRQIVLTMEKDGSGRITLNNFKDLIYSIKYWEEVFKRHSTEKVGVLVVERFRDALREVGFVVSEKVMAILVIKYMRKDGMLRFGDFVSAIVLLDRAFNMFFIHCAKRTRKLKLLFPQWLKLALTC